VAGEDVVVKVQRPGIAALWKATSRSYASWHVWLKAHCLGKVYSFSALVEQFGRELHEQLDFACEGGTRSTRASPFR